jgi:hypothetical protein
MAAILSIRAGGVTSSLGNRCFFDESARLTDLLRITDRECENRQPVTIQAGGGGEERPREVRPLATACEDCSIPIPAPASASWSRDLADRGCLKPDARLCGIALAPARELEDDRDGLRVAEVQKSWPFVSQPESRVREPPRHDVFDRHPIEQRNTPTYRTS